MRLTMSLLVLLTLAVLAWGQEAPPQLASFTLSIAREDGTKLEKWSDTIQSIVKRPEGVDIVKTLKYSGKGYINVLPGSYDFSLKYYSGCYKTTMRVELVPGENNIIWTLPPSAPLTLNTKGPDGKPNNRPFTMQALGKDGKTMPVMPLRNIGGGPGSLHSDAFPAGEWTILFLSPLGGIMGWVPVTVADKETTVEYSFPAWANTRYEFRTEDDKEYPTHGNFSMTLLRDGKPFGPAVPMGRCNGLMPGDYLVEVKDSNERMPKTLNVTLYEGMNVVIIKMAQPPLAFVALTAPDGTPANPKFISAGLLPLDDGGVWKSGIIPVPASFTDGKLKIKLDSTGCKTAGKYRLAILTDVGYVSTEVLLTIKETQDLEPLKLLQGGQFQFIPAHNYLGVYLSAQDARLWPDVQQGVSGWGKGIEIITP